MSYTNHEKPFTSQTFRNRELTPLAIERWDEPFSEQPPAETPKGRALIWKGKQGSRAPGDTNPSPAERGETVTACNIIRNPNSQTGSLRFCSFTLLPAAVPSCGHDALPSHSEFEAPSQSLRKQQFDSSGTRSDSVGVTPRNENLAIATGPTCAPRCSSPGGQKAQKLNRAVKDYSAQQPPRTFTRGQRQ